MVGLCEPPGCWLFWTGDRLCPGYGGGGPWYGGGNCPGFEPGGRLWAFHSPEAEPALGLPFLFHSGSNTMVACFSSTMIVTSSFSQSLFVTLGKSPLDISCSKPAPGPCRTSIKCEGIKITVDHWHESSLLQSISSQKCEVFCVLRSCL